MINCPKCKKQIANKVSDVYEQGCHEVSCEKPLSHDFFGKTIYYGTVPEKAIVLSSLANKLSPPIQPFYYGLLLSSEQKLWGSIIRVIISFGLLLALFYFLLVDITNNLYWVTELVMILSIVMFFIQLAIDVNKVRVVIGQKNKWECSLRLWRALYYCTDCDIVISPEKKFVEAEKLANLLEE